MARKVRKHKSPTSTIPEASAESKRDGESSTNAGPTCAGKVAQTLRQMVPVLEEAAKVITALAALSLAVRGFLATAGY